MVNLNSYQVLVEARKRHDDLADRIRAGSDLKHSLVYLHLEETLSEG